jgi:hypothetical protein
MDVLAWLNTHADANTLLLVAMLAQLRFGFRALWKLSVRIANHLGVATDDLQPPTDSKGVVSEVVAEIEHADTQPNLQITKVGPPPPPVVSIAPGGKP